MDDAQIKYIRKMMELMVDKQFLPAGMNRKRRSELEKTLSERAKSLRTQFEKDVKKLADKETAQAERKKIEKNIENLAQALPELAKGTLSAITAFKSGDAISGAAAIMDICASLTPLLAGLSAAGGPPGMLVGAIFALVGQILSFFAPDSKSLTDEIEELLRDLSAEKTQQDITTVHERITVYASSLRDAADMASTELDKDGALLNLMIVDEIVKVFNPLEGNIVTRFGNVMNWLKEPKNHTLDLWPVILSAACNAWADMMSAALTLLSLVHTDQLQDQYEKAKKLTDSEKTGQTEFALMKLQASVIGRLLLLKADNKIVMKKLDALVEAAQNRGMFWQIADNKEGSLYFGTNISQGKFTYLNNSEYKRIAVAVTRKDIDSPDPTYYVLNVEVWGYGKYDRTYIAEVKSPYQAAHHLQLLDGNGHDAAFRSLSDIWAEPGSEPSKPNELWVYTAKDKVITGYRVNGGENKATNTGYSVTLKAKVASVRVIRDAQSFLDDPDNAPGILTGVEFFVYGGLARENSEIYVDAGNGRAGYVPSPWGGYDGIGVDRHYLWVFGSGGLACATHASVMRCLNEKKGTPRWMGHFPNHLLYEGNQNPTPRPDPKPLLGLVDLCPCEDGTLVAALYKRTVVKKSYGGKSMYHYYEFVDYNGLYSAVYYTDLEKGKIEVEWTKIPSVTGVRVQKVPVFCWSLFESLPAMLERLAPQLDSLTRRPKRALVT